MNPHWNPRVLVWLKAVGLTVEAITRRAGEDLPRVVVDGERNIWTVHYGAWIEARWREWAIWHGQADGNHRAEWLGRFDDFDEWLERNAHDDSTPAGPQHPGAHQEGPEGQARRGRN